MTAMVLVKNIVNCDSLDFIFGGCNQLISVIFYNFIELVFIENIWAYIKEKIEEEEFENVSLLKKRIITIWRKITPAMCSKWINSIPRRLQALIKKNGNSINKSDYGNV